MSHKTTIHGVAIRDVDAIFKAAERLQADGVNCEIVENGTCRMYGTSERCDYVLNLKDGSYDVGFQYDESQGAYSPVFDEWQKHVANQVGADVNACPMPNTPEGKAQHAIGQFMQAYSECAAANAAIAEGYSVEQVTRDVHGNVHMVIGNC